MIRVYLYRKTDGETVGYAWQHGMGQRLLEWVKRQTENSVLDCYNVSHSQGLVAVAAADVPVGVDVEGERVVKRRVAERILSGREQLYLLAQPEQKMTFLQFWTLKEAYGKALRVGLAYPLRQVEMLPLEPAPDEEWQRVSCSDGGMSCFSLLKTDYVLSVCACSPKEDKPFFYMLQNVPSM